MITPYNSKPFWFEEKKGFEEKKVNFVECSDHNIDPPRSFLNFTPRGKL
jgi:Zn/Cd-binding protein ZinT